MLGIERQLAPIRRQLRDGRAGTALGAVRPERRHHGTRTGTHARHVAIRPVGEGAAATKAEADELAVDARVDQMAGRRDLRPRRPVGQVAARIRRRRVELQRRQRQVVELAHAITSVAAQGPGPRRRRRVYQFAQLRGKFAPANRARADAPGARSPAGSRSAACPRRRIATRCRQRHLRCVGVAREHRLAEEHAAERDTVQAADQHPSRHASTLARARPRAAPYTHRSLRGVIHVPR